MGGFKIDTDFFLDAILSKSIKNRQKNKLPKSLASIDGPLWASASMVTAKLERIRVIVMIRRDQRSEVCNEIRVVINMDIPLMPAAMCMFYLVSHPSRRAHMMYGLHPAGFSSIAPSTSKRLYRCFAFPASKERTVWMEHPFLS